MARVLPPVLINFPITRKCNLKCPHCYSQAQNAPHPDEMSTQEIKKVISEVAKCGTKMIIFDGGEPTLREDLLELIRHANDVGLMPLLGTNATLITQEFARSLKDAGLVAAAISLDGYKKEIYDAFRGVEGSFDMVIEGLKNLLNADVGFQIDPCMHRDNLPYLEEIAKLSKQKGSVALEIFDFVPTGRGKDAKRYEISQENRKRLIRRVITMAIEDEEMIFRLLALPQYWIEVEKMVPEKMIAKRFIRTCCGAGIRFATIMYDGTVYPCMLLQEEAGNVREKSFKDIWHNSTLLKALRNRDNLKGKCKHCKYRTVCGGARCKAYIKTGDPFAEDPDCWYDESEIRCDQENDSVKKIEII